MPATTRRASGNRLPDALTTRSTVHDTPDGGHFTVTIPNDPQAVPCPSCGAGRLQPCTWARKPRRATVHAARSDRWLRTVERQNAAARWIDYPADETPQALAARRGAMHARWCAERRVTEFVLRLHRLERAVEDLTLCEPCEAERGAS